MSDGKPYTLEELKGIRAEAQGCLDKQDVMVVLPQSVIRLLDAAAQSVKLAESVDAVLHELRHNATAIPIALAAKLDALRAARGPVGKVVGS